MVQLHKLIAWGFWKEMFLKLKIHLSLMKTRLSLMLPKDVAIKCETNRKKRKVKKYSVDHQMEYGPKALTVRTI